jgi:hypothetical protein
MFPIQNLIVHQRAKNHKAGPLDASVALYNADGTPFTATPASGAAVADAAGDAPTKAEFDALLKSLRDAGIIASS